MRYPAKTVIFCVLAVYLLLGAALCQALTPEERKIVGQMRDSITQLRGKLEAAQAANEGALSALALAAAQSVDLVDEARSAAARAASLAAERDRIAAELSVAEAKAADLNKKYQRAQLIIAIAAAVIAGLLAVQFTHNLQPPYGILVPVAAGAAAFFGVYIIL
jgi:hypothetical protein